MKKRDKIIYWTATIWLSLGMLSTGVVQLLKTGEEAQDIMAMGYPGYFLTILGIWKILGVAVLLLPGLLLLKEWAYAGFFFTMSGAVFSHIAHGSHMIEFFGPMLLLILIATSWYFRPANRKIVQVKPI
jgi:hypothetical protein